MSHAPVNWLAALSSFLVGGIWYSPLLFARPWMEASGLSREELARGGTARIFGGSFALSLVSAVNLAFFLADGRRSVASGITAGALAGVGWVATSLGTTYLFERRRLRLYLIDAGYHAVTFALMGAIPGIWK
jgi:hypothetical protein